MIKMGTFVKGTGAGGGITIATSAGVAATATGLATQTEINDQEHTDKKHHRGDGYNDRHVAASEPVRQGIAIG